MFGLTLKYEVQPGENLPAGLPRLQLTVLSPIWRGPALHLEYPDGDAETLVGVTAGGEPCEVLVFWTRPAPRGPAVCLAIGGDGGLRREFRQGDRSGSRGLAFLALAASLIPPEVRKVVGSAPLAGEAPLLLA